MARICHGAHLRPDLVLFRAAGLNAFRVAWLDTRLYLERQLKCRSGKSGDISHVV